MTFTAGPHRDHTQRSCQGCRFWSEMIASGAGAMCLNVASDRFQKYMGGQQRCAQWRIGHLGAIDQPGSTGDEYQRAETRRRSISDDDQCSDCMRCSAPSGSLQLAACTEGWPGDEDDDGYVVRCVMFVLRGSARDNSAGDA